MITQFPQLSPQPQKIRDKIAEAVLLRLRIHQPHKRALFRAWVWLKRPDHAVDGFQFLYRSCDAIWRMIGDTSQDWNFYTKRLLLSGVYITTLMAWFQDDNPNMQETKDFLYRRIADVMKIQTTHFPLNRWVDGLKKKIFT